MRKTASLSTAVILCAVVIANMSVTAQTRPTPGDTRAVAKQAYIYGFPIVAEYSTMYAFSIDKNNPQYKGPFNSILNFARVFTPADTTFVTPNSDTPYTFMGLDLRAEPVVITVPPMAKNRYFVFQMLDLYTFNFDYIGTRTTGNDGGNFLVAGPGWKEETPKGVTKVIHSETELVSVVGRTQLFNPADLANVKKIQAGYNVQPLSAFLGKPAPPAAPTPDWVQPVPPSEMRTSLDLFNVLSFVLQFCPTPESEKLLRGTFAEIGIVARKPFDVESLSAETKVAIQAGMADGQKEIGARRAAVGGKVDDLFGTRAFLKNDYVARATGAQIGIGANSKEEALYPIYEKDSSGELLDGSKGRYTLHFAKNEFPPVNAFWSLTMYGLLDQLLVKNPINRYLINSPMLPSLKLDADGGLTISIQADSTGAKKEANWLPAPRGPFMLAMRYYLPKPELLDGQWKSPDVVRVK
ncbi:MAG: DUF1254 domain-containing protein [Candidatus Acidiferrales bacterium]